ncbi:MAG: stage II sporulation protein R [Clostridia bacterium]|nr:stage II sporulation protein R [Clostridia bacterium]
MKKTFNAIILLLFLTLTIAVLPTDAEAGIYNDTIRLHILANSDKEEDQQLKLKIRNKVLEKYSNELKYCENIEDAQVLFKSILPQLKKDCEDWVKELGYDYSIRCELSEEWYETRDYESFSLPCGYYKSLRIIIGNGNGKNWWCVMYPPLCTSLATEKAPCDDTLINYTKEEILLIENGGYNIKFKSLELISKLFSKK